jgi:hypothetical protein
MQEYLIVDGYNIINAWPELKEVFKENIEAARDKLIEIMAGYQAYKGIRVIIVFDGHLVKGNTGTHEMVDGVQVVYTKEHETADSYIEKNVKIMAKRALVRVATSDWTEQQVIMAMGGIRISASELKSLVNGFGKDIKRKFLEKGNNNINTVDSNLSPDVMRKLKKWRKEK